MSATVTSVGYLGNFRSMESGILTKYSASAGSGKTYKLTAIYLSRILKAPSAYRKILAVTFTHKASADMKRKIMSQLSALAAGERTPMDSFLVRETGRSYEDLSSTASTVLKNILTDYTWFSVGTIDSFFQRVLKSFAREINLHQGYSIELEHDLILCDAVDSMLADSAKDKDLLRWLAAWSDSRLAEGKNWNLRSEILHQASEIFSEKFRLLPEEDRKNLRSREFLESYVTELRMYIDNFTKTLVAYAERCSDILISEGVTGSMFFQGESRGVPSFLKSISARNNDLNEPPNSYVMKVLDDPPVWTSKAGPSPNLINAFNSGFDTLFRETLTWYLENYKRANTAILILRNIYTLGILSDVLSRVHNITTEENKFLLSDAGELLSRITGNDQSPFIYEKIGTTFENYMIDEFQDTSHIQWKNFRPLIADSMASGFNNLIVGDLKQSIYRWRNSDWSIFGRLVEEQVGSKRMQKENLGINWRSSRRIISFNNTVFSLIPSLIDDEGKHSSEGNRLSDIFAGAAQECPVSEESGVVEISFSEVENEERFRKDVLEKLPRVIEQLQDKGYKGSDIGILVRKKSEGAEILDTLMSYSLKSGENAKQKYSWKVVSDESLLLANSPVTGIILTVLEIAEGANDDLKMAILIRYAGIISGRQEQIDELIIKKGLAYSANEILPPRFTEFASAIREMSLYNAVEAVISYFSLGEIEGQAPWLAAFQDAVMEYSGSLSADIPGFLKWWETTGVKRSVILPDHRDSMKIMTIHKAKGLEFKIVIVPFINWGLGHASPPLMWIPPPEGPLGRFSLVPVRFSSAMEHSAFAGHYYNERFAAAVDNLNLLYVAFTRAIDGLYGFCRLNSKTSYLSKWLADALKSGQPDTGTAPSISPSEFYNTASDVFSFGELTDRPPDETDKAGITAINSYRVDETGERLKIKFQAEDWLSRLSDERASRINYGKIMHEILESVFLPADVDKVMAALVKAGKISVSEIDGISASVKNAISDPRVINWFSGKEGVISENDIIIPEGAVKRPDRVIVRAGITTVIEFKFGEEKKSHIAQVKEYMRLLILMGHENTEGYLWYADKGIVKKV